MNVAITNWRNLTDEEKSEASNNGVGKEDANYLRVTWEDGTTETFSDAMEPEDALFTRDLSWISDLVVKAYNVGARLT